MQVVGGIIHLVVIDVVYLLNVYHCVEVFYPNHLLIAYRLEETLYSVLKRVCIFILAVLLVVVLVHNDVCLYESFTLSCNDFHKLLFQFLPFADFIIPVRNSFIKSFANSHLILENNPFEVFIEIAFPLCETFYILCYTLHHIRTNSSNMCSCSSFEMFRINRNVSIYSYQCPIDSPQCLKRRSLLELSIYFIKFNSYCTSYLLKKISPNARRLWGNF